MAHAWNPNIQETEIGEQKVQSQLGLLRAQHASGYNCFGGYGNNSTCF